MRSRENVQGDAVRPYADNNARNQILILEVLLDIRDLLITTDGAKPRTGV